MGRQRKSITVGGYLAYLANDCLGVLAMQHLEVTMFCGMSQLLSQDDGRGKGMIFEGGTRLTSLKIVFGAHARVVILYLATL